MKCLPLRQNKTWASFHLSLNSWGPETHLYMYEGIRKFMTHHTNMCIGNHKIKYQMIMNYIKELQAYFLLDSHIIDITCLFYCVMCLITANVIPLHELSRHFYGKSVVQWCLSGLPWIQPNVMWKLPYKQSRNWN